MVSQLALHDGLHAVVVGIGGVDLARFGGGTVTRQERVHRVRLAVGELPVVFVFRNLADGDVAHRGLERGADEGRLVHQDDLRAVLRRRAGARLAGQTRTDDDDVGRKALARIAGRGAFFLVLGRAAAQCQRASQHGRAHDELPSAQ